MSFTNRVDPFGQLFPGPSRGTLMGNRGCIHDEYRQIRGRPWQRKAWISCRLDWKGIRRQVMSPGRYTELFFLDEATALSAGHRPCNDCRREALTLFREAFAKGQASLGRQVRLTSQVDDILHAERLNGDGSKRRHQAPIQDLPSGVMFEMHGQLWLVQAGKCLRWTPGGYDLVADLPSSGDVTVLTPPSTCLALSQGYRFEPHPSVHGLIPASG